MSWVLPTINTHTFLVSAIHGHTDLLHDQNDVSITMTFDDMLQIVQLPMLGRVCLTVCMTACV